LALAQATKARCVCHIGNNGPMCRFNSVPNPSERYAAEILDNPMTVVAIVETHFQPTRRLEIDSAGHARLIVGENPPQNIQTSKEGLDALRKTLIRERFFELKGEYGERPHDSGSSTLIITIGRVTKTVQLRS